MPGVTLLDSEMDPDHNRSVLTFAGEPEPVMEAAFRAVIARASQLIDLNQHHGQHPRMGATDVVPFVPVEGVTLEDCAELARAAREAHRRGAGHPGVPLRGGGVASRPREPRRRAARRVRGPARAIGKDPKQTPDFGPERDPPDGRRDRGRRAALPGGVQRQPEHRRRARGEGDRGAIREQSGGLKNVRALGFSIEGGRRAQVSMNLVNTEATPIHRVLALVRDEAARHGAAISGCEVVGLVPEYAMLDAAEHALQLEGFRRDQVLELRLQAPRRSPRRCRSRVLDSVAGATPTPGGGTVAAVAGALAASLRDHGGEPDDREEEVRRARGGAAGREARGRGAARASSLGLGPRATARRSTRCSGPRRLPQASAAEVAAREGALAAADLEAARVPLQTAEACLEVLELAALAARNGNPNAVSDAGVAGLLARAGGEGALSTSKST